MKILAFTDPHGDVQDAEAIVRLSELERPEAMVCAGDFSLFGNNYQAFFKVLSRMGRQVFLVGGNHEADGLMHCVTEEFSFLVDVAYRVHDVQGIQIGGIPGYDRDFWPSRRIDRQVVSLIRDLLVTIDPVRPFVFLTHFPPAGAVDGLSRPLARLSYSPTEDAGGSATVGAIVRALAPTLVVTGHYHSEFGHEGRLGASRVVNPGPAGRILELPVPAASRRE